MEESNGKNVEIVVEEQDKYNVLSAVVFDVLASELPEESQELLPGGGEIIKQASEDNLTVKTNVMESVPIDPIPAESCAGIGAISALTIAGSIIAHVDQGKMEDASSVLKYLGNELIKEGNIVYLYSESTKVIGRGIIIAGNVCVYASKSVEFFLKFMPKPKIPSKK